MKLRLQRGSGPVLQCMAQGFQPARRMRDDNAQSGDHARGRETGNATLGTRARGIGAGRAGASVSQACRLGARRGAANAQAVGRLRQGHARAYRLSLSERAAGRACSIPDFRTVENRRTGHPSPDLLETIYLCQQRQEWYRDYVRSLREEPLPFIGSVTPENDIVQTAAEIRHALGFEIEERRKCPTWTEALRRFIEQADRLGVLVMVNGVVGSNNHRKLSPDEFRGFAISDDLAPLVFINGADTKSAQMFTLAHELAHLWLGQSALSDMEASSAPTHRVENWCNRVAAELLVPLAVFREQLRPDEDCGRRSIGLPSTSR
ncbi:MAG: ImmA/IrrE family metallo-endopeptidase [Rhodoplanes sp.]